MHASKQKRPTTTTTIKPSSGSFMYDHGPWVQPFIKRHHHHDRHLYKALFYRMRCACFQPIRVYFVLILLHVPCYEYTLRNNVYTFKYTEHHGNISGF